MRGISTLEVSILARELNGYSGMHLEKFYDLGNGRFRIRLKEAGRDVSLLCIPCHTINRTSYIEKTDTPSNFCMAVRKRISGLLLNRVYQLNRDRIIVFELQGHERSANLIFEMFGKGNLIITDSAMKITLSYSQRNFRERSTRVGSEYAAPSKGHETRAETESVFSYLSSVFDFGPVYIEDALLRHDIDAKTERRSVDAKALSAMERELSELREAEGEGAIVYFSEGNPVDYSVKRLAKYKGLDSEQFGSLQEALERVYSEEEEQNVESPEVKAVRSSIEKQRALLDSLQKESVECREKGKLVFSHMNDLNRMIASAKANKRITKEELQGLFPNYTIKQINLREKTILVELA